MSEKYSLIDYNEYIKHNKKIEKLKIKDLECKHIPQVCGKYQVWIDLANKVDYKWVVFGSHRNTPERDRLSYEIERIYDICKSNLQRPIRIVKTSNGLYFSDNTHWSLAYMLRFGKDVKLTQIPFYIVDFSNPNGAVIVDFKNSVIKNEDDIKKAVCAAYDVEARIKKGWRNSHQSYILIDFYQDLKLNCAIL